MSTEAYHREGDPDYIAMEEKMEDLVKFMKEIMLELKEVRKGQQEYHSHIKELKQENKEMKEKIEELQGKIEALEKDKKKNNIIVSGISENAGDEDAVKEEVAKVLKEELKIEANIKSTRRIATGKYIIKMEKFTEKLEILRKKHRLKQAKNKIIYINDDLTKAEIEIQQKITEVAKKEKQNGKHVKMGFMKLYINGKEWKWDHKENKLKESKN